MGKSDFRIIEIVFFECECCNNACKSLSNSMKSNKGIRFFFVQLNGCYCIEMWRENGAACVEAKLFPLIFILFRFFSFHSISIVVFLNTTFLDMLFLVIQPFQHIIKVGTGFSNIFYCASHKTFAEIKKKCTFVD